VPVGDVPLHIDLRALDVLSRYGPPANFPAPVGATGRTHDAQGYSSPIRQAMMACNYLTGISGRAPNSIFPPPPTPDAGSEGPHPSSRSSGTTSVGAVRSGTRIPGRAVGEGLGQGPVDPPPPTDRRSSLASAPTRFNTGTEWKRYCTPPPFLGHRPNASPDRSNTARPWDTRRWERRRTCRRHPVRNTGTARRRPQTVDRPHQPPETGKFQQNMVGLRTRTTTTTESSGWSLGNLGKVHIN
jgi:hypothetical protein